MAHGNENKAAGRDERHHQIRHALELVKEDGVLLPCKLIGEDEHNNGIIRRRQQHSALHNYIVRQVERIKKYDARGIAVVEDDDDHINAINEFEIRRINVRGDFEGENL